MLYCTSVDISKPPKTISHQDAIMLLGSCFTTHIAQKLKSHLFNVLDNPFGILYNPASIEQSILGFAEKRYNRLNVNNIVNIFLLFSFTNCKYFSNFSKKSLQL